MKLAIGVVLLLTLQACYLPSTEDRQTQRSSAPPSSTAPAMDQAYVDWFEKACVSDKQAQEFAYTQVPRNAPPKESVVEYITTLQQGPGILIGMFETLKPAPMPGGDEVVAAYVRALTKTKEDLVLAVDMAGTEVGGVDVSLTFTGGVLLTLRPDGADLPGLAARSPELERAYKAAITCQRVPRPLKATP